MATKCPDCGSSHFGSAKSCQRCGAILVQSVVTAPVRPTADERRAQTQRSTAERCLERAYAYANRGHPRPALRECELAIRRDPSFAEAYNLRATQLEMLERYDEALTSYRQAVALDPEFELARENLHELEEELAEEAEEEEGKRPAGRVRHVVIGTAEEPSGAVKVLLSPLMLYLLAGTGLLYVFCKIEELAISLGRWRVASFVMVRPVQWHNKDLKVVLAFPLLSPVLLARSLVLITLAIFGTVVVLIVDGLMWLWRDIMTIVLFAARLVRKAWTSVVASIGTLVARILSVFSAATHRIYTVIQALARAVMWPVRKLWAGLVIIASTVWRWIATAATALGRWLAVMLPLLWRGLTWPVRKLWGGLVIVASTVWRWIATAATTLGRWLAIVLPLMWRGLTWPVRKLWAGLVIVVSTVWRWIATAATALGRWLAVVLPLLWRGLTWPVRKLWGGLVIVASTVWRWIATAATALGRWLAVVLPLLWRGLTWPVRKLWAGLVIVVSTVWRWIATAVGAAAGWLSRVLPPLWRALSWPARRLWAGLVIVASTVWRWVVRAFVAMRTWISAVLRAVWRRSAALLNTLKVALSKLASQIASQIRHGMSMLQEWIRRSVEVTRARIEAMRPR